MVWDMLNEKMINDWVKCCITCGVEGITQRTAEKDLVELC